MPAILTDNLNKIPAERLNAYVFLFILLHTLAWTLAPTWVRYTLPMDSIEGAIWGHQLDWGYDKNPYMNAWLTALAIHIGGYTSWIIYLFSQISVAICFWAVWQLGKKIVPPIQALIAVLILEGIQYFNVHAVDFDDNVLELSLWALSILCFYHALIDQKLRYWLLTGLFAGLSVMTKYYTAMLLLSMLIFMLITPQTYKYFKKPALYFGLCVFFAVMAPHFIWLFSHDFITVNYAVNRISSKPTWINHIHYPALFIWQQVEVFLPALFLLLFVILPKKTPAKLTASPTPTEFDKTFLFVLGLGPFLLTVLLSVCTGIKLRAGWGQPLLTFWGLLLLACFMPLVTRRRFRRFMIAFGIIFIGIVISYSAALMRANKPSSANFPGQEIALTLEHLWQNQFHQPLFYIVGPRWVAGNIAFYSKSHPSVYIDANKKLSPWIDEANIKQQGAIFVWDPTEEYQMPVTELKARFNKLGPIQIMHFTWSRNKNMKPIEISVGFLPPSAK